MNRDAILYSKADLVVIGSGFAGMTAAIAGAEAGASVVVLEKMKAIGGNSVISDGGIAAACTDIQKVAGVTDTSDLMYADMLQAGEGINHPGLLRVVTEGAQEAFLWTKDELGVAYQDRVEQFGGHSKPRCHTPVAISGAPLVQAMALRLKTLKVPIILGANVFRLECSTDGRVTGVSYTMDNNTPRIVQAEKGVIVATGGFGADIAFRKAQDPRLDESIATTNKPMATAEILKECMRLGANPVQLSRIQMGPWTSPDERGFGVGPLFGEYVLFPYGIMIHPSECKRFVNELGDRKLVSEALLALKQPAVGIADSGGVAAAGVDLKKAIQRGIVKAFDSLETLAIMHDLDKEYLIHSVEGFNKAVRTAFDAGFGKTILREAKPIETPPFYAMRVWPKVHYTMGGVQIDTKARVIHRDQHVIPGLFAAGEVTGGIHGASRLSCCAITECLVMGRIAGKEAAKETSHNY